MRTVEDLASTFNVVSGLTDHTLSISAAIASVALAGSVIEKHFTINWDDGGPDAPFSLMPKEFSKLVVECNKAWLSLCEVDYTLKEVEKNKAISKTILKSFGNILA